MMAERQMSSIVPYLLKAHHEWMLDNELTPYVIVNTEHEDTQVPQSYIKEGTITLNVGPLAIEALEISHEQVSFQARFSGKWEGIHFSPLAVIAIYAKENGLGAVFDARYLDEKDNKRTKKTPIKEASKKSGESKKPIEKEQVISCNEDQVLGKKQAALKKKARKKTHLKLVR